MGDISIDSLNRQDAGHSKLVSFFDVFGLSNLGIPKTCFTKNSSSSIDAILTNRPRCFQKTSVFETGQSDYHGPPMTAMKSHLPRLKVTVLSTPVSSELPFCKTTVLRKQLISPILFGRSKIGKKDVVLHGLGNREICKSQCFR